MIDVTVLRVSTPTKVEMEYRMLKKNVRLRISKSEPFAHRPERMPRISQMPAIVYVVQRKMNVKPPTYLYRSKTQRWMGFTKRKSMVPLRNMFGKKKDVMTTPTSTVTHEPTAITRK